MTPFLLAAIVLLVWMTLVFLLALARQDNSIVDIAYGVAFILAGWAAYLAAGSGHQRQLLVLGLVTVWGLRLAWHILLRKRGEQGEDFRYRKWREEWGRHFIWRSYLQVFLLQGGVVFLVSLPVLVVISRPGGPLGWLDAAGSALWAFGLLFEAVGDWQLLRFKQDPANRGRIMQTGLWRYTRHPNYFGEAVLWWGMLLIALGSPLGYWAIIGPVLINVLLLKVSGIPMLEDKYSGNPEYERYKQRTNAFFPWFPRKTPGGAT